jgi:hypothetical protein
MRLSVVLITCFSLLDLWAEAALQINQTTTFAQLQDMVAVDYPAVLRYSLDGETTYVSSEEEWQAAKRVLHRATGLKIDFDFSLLEVNKGLSLPGSAEGATGLPLVFVHIPKTVELKAPRDFIVCLFVISIFSVCRAGWPFASGCINTALLETSSATFRLLPTTSTRLRLTSLAGQKNFAHGWMLLAAILSLPQRLRHLLPEDKTICCGQATR